MRRYYRAEQRVIRVVDTSDSPVGFVVRGWHPGQPVIGPFVSYEMAFKAALGNTQGLVEGAWRRHG